MRLTVPSLSIAALCLLLLPGCLPTGHWIEGRWEFDEARTRSANDEILKGDSGPIFGTLKQLVGGAVEEAMTYWMEGTVIEFTGSEFRTLQGDAGQAVSYKIIEKPGPQTVVVQFEDGKIMTYHRDAPGLWFKPAKDLSLKVYLKPAS
jgi:glucose dehydrogenase